LFNIFNGFWLYDNSENEFKVRDLGYNVGYVICEKYYNKALNKKQAIKEMIELNYNDENELSNFVDKSDYFTNSLAYLKIEYNKNRPVVTGVKQFQNESQKVAPGLIELTIEFSELMDQNYRNFELGPLGQPNLLRLKKFIGFSEDGKPASFEIELKPNQRYQLLVGEGFRNSKGILLKPYLVDFKTDDN